MAEETIHGAERMKFFTDAVVAIAMTLLILPLLESVSEAADEGLGTADFLGDHAGQLLAFALSFVIIANFWVGHEQLFGHVARWSGTLMLLNVAWMLSIVFLPVVTAMVGSMEVDALQIVLYVGTMLVTSLLLTAMNLVVRRDPGTWSGVGGPDPDSLRAGVSTAILFVAALVLGLVPGVGYLALLVLLLTPAVSRLLVRLWPGALS